MMNEEQKDRIKEIVKNYFEGVFGKKSVGEVEVYGPPEGPHEGIFVHFAKMIDRNKFIDSLTELSNLLEEKNLWLPTGYIVREGKYARVS
ncbi:MAG: hypothetical protein ACE5J3_07485 [Methanosarcinales archaeon]